MNNNFLTAFELKKKPRRMALNITPIVDVMLVLVTVLMAISQTEIGSIDVDLPTSSTGNKVQQEKNDPIIITVSKDEQIYLMDELILKEILIPKLIGITKENKNTLIYIKGDKSAHYNDIIQTISFINAAGFTKISLMVDNVTTNQIQNVPDVKQNYKKQNQ